MDKTTDTIDTRLKHFEEICLKKGIKVTHQRLEIFKEIALTDDHPDAERVYLRVRRRLQTISQDTVYRTLWLLQNLGLITSRGGPRERTRFDGNLNRHHHFVCSVCGDTRDFYSEELNNLKLPAPVESFGHIDTTRVEVRGICRTCAQEKR